MHDMIIRYIKVVSTLVFTGAVIFVILSKVWGASVSLGTISLDTTDVLSIILAVFAVILSVLFYFKSSEESGRFYQNSYQFTKEVSEILGRIEAGFGERLKHLDEGYSAMTRRVDDVLAEKGKVEKEIENEEVELKETRQEREQMINSLFEKVNATEDEKREMRKALAEKEKELDYAKRQMTRLRQQVSELEDEVMQGGIDLHPDLHQALASLGKIIGLEHFVHAPTSWLNRKIKDATSELTEETNSSLYRHSILNKEMELTGNGRKLLRDFGKGLTNLSNRTR
ncbi:hypothetical protein [Shewanella sp.]|uniref:hypothetical protein n=1 Tax=Shewanella sp. TaxID=50422 RepID=UPI00260AA2AE|nr:hypothetical protein [Shewanella sp.]